jgi:hypothetical protein
VIVWVVVEAYDYEGLGPPEGVFSTLEAARAKVVEIMAKAGRADDVIIYECVVDGAVKEV